ncbi:glycoside hydrolase family 76 protein [Legionella cardiaca]|uniref:Glycoside hydrolase family 76 protein n=1 Tax=Legionella cardiaca TaxID=1071983 RepID=A0ABY8APG6_9GAMM|nr:glycoside hydrolase family 76 protein [Legionella cardiaca]WED42605.1 glycoside hydrolase family 76 protein [Legionella cardiaca]
MQKIIKTIALLIPFHLILLTAQASTTANLPSSAPTINQNQEFRDMVMDYVRAVANHKILNTPLPVTQLDEIWGKSYQIPDWSLQIVIYYQGSKIGFGTTHGKSLADVIRTATEKSLKYSSLPQITAKELEKFRFKASFDYYPHQSYSFIEYLGKGLELLGNRVAIRLLDTQLIKQQIANSQHYLLNVMHPALHGFFKFYQAGTDHREDKLRTIYSSSSLYTFLKLYQLNHDPALEKNFKPIANFILSMQVKSGPNAGGFYYSYDPATDTKQCRVVVGTTSKTIFTLLELYRFYNDDSYLTAAKKAGDWLLTMVKPDGNVTPIAICHEDQWHLYDKNSFLYSGQVLSALSRLYTATKDQRYYEGATKIAEHFRNEVQKQGIYVGDSFRPKNSISTSWLLMSMIDYAKINSQEIYRNLIRQAAAKILSLQITDNSDAYTYGRYRDATTPSGNGWINEVLGVLYDYCINTHLGECEQYRKPMILTTRWLIQNAYSKENTYDVKNPAQAIGGFITNFSQKTVRTDAVCHGVNSLISLLNMIDKNDNTNQTLLTVPERPLADILPSLRWGKGFL